MTDTIHNVPRELLERAWRALANSATGREIGAYLDADHCAPECAETCARASMCSTCSAILSAPSPAGVDGLDVVGWYRMDDRKAITPYPSVCATWHKMGVKVGAAYSDSAHAIIDGLRGEVGAQRVKTCTALKERNDGREERDAAATECERLRMQLAACGVVALSNTIESAGKARQMHPDYMSASCSDVAGAVDREIALRTERDQQAHRIGELEGLLREVHDTYRAAIHWEDLRGTMKRIDAALPAGKDSDQ